MKAIIYCRVSTPGQAKNTSFDTQADNCLEYCQSNGVEIVGIYKEIASGDLPFQHLLRKAIAQIENGEADSLVFSCMDRLSRDKRAYAAVGRAVRSQMGKMINVSLSDPDSPDSHFAEWVEKMKREIHDELVRA